MAYRSAVLLLILAGCASSSSGPSSDPTPLSDSKVVAPTASTYIGNVWIPGDGELVFTDEATGSSFNLLGQAFAGSLADDSVQLGRLPGMSGFWFAWSSHHPGARVWSATGQDRTNQGTTTLSRTEECGVPCEEIISGCFSGKDCIPSIDRPTWTTPDDTDRLGYLAPDDRVMGVTFSDGSARAYPLDALWTHEIVNDTYDDWAFSLTYCPLTASGMIVDGDQGTGEVMRFGVSGRLYNSNLVLYDRNTDSLYGQLRQVGITGDRIDAPLRVHAAIDTTWDHWTRMAPNTEVLADDVGISGYPYGDYRTNDADTFITNVPQPEDWYPNKSYAIGIMGDGETVIYAFDELRAAVGDRGIIQDTVGDIPIVVAFDDSSQTAILYSRAIDGDILEFTSP